MATLMGWSYPSPPSPPPEDYHPHRSSESSSSCDSVSVARPLSGAYAAFSPPSVLRPVPHATSLDHDPSSSPRSVLPPIDMAPAPPSPQPQTVSALATFASEMFTWLWFAPSPRNVASSSSTTFDRAFKQQVAPSDRFMRFCHDVLTTTQVSHSVVLLALLFVSRLKERNAISGASGSEFRLATTALMVANKVLDDNTYTARTWSEVSSLELKPLVAGEAEFLRGLDFRLHVTQREFASWTKLLEGHVARRKFQLASRDSSVSTRTSSKRPRQADPPLSEDLVGLGFGADVQFDARRPILPLSPQHISQRWTSHSTPSSERPTPRLPSFALPPKHATLTPSHFSSSPNPFATFSPSPLDTNTPSRASRLTTGARRQSHVRAISDCYRFQPGPTQLSPVTSMKRGAADAFGDEGSHERDSSKRITSTWLARSYSDGSSPAPPRALFAHPQSVSPPYAVHHSHLEQSPGDGYFSTTTTPVTATWTSPTVASARSDGFQYLADAFSPTYSYHYNRAGPEGLSYYSLAAGQRQGVPHQTSAQGIYDRSYQSSGYTSTPRMGGYLAHEPALLSHFANHGSAGVAYYASS